MNNRTIEIIIGTTGEIQIGAVGFKGPDCEKATAFLEEALVLEKLWRVVKPAASVCTANTIPQAPLPPEVTLPYRVLPDSARDPAFGKLPSVLV